MEAQRLAKRLAAQLGCSRSQAEQYIAGGWVRVDGQLVEEPQFRVTDQKIEIDPAASLLELAPVTLLLHKPADVAQGQELLQEIHHWPGDASATRVLKRHFKQLTPGLPLEPAASGLMVYTQDWRVARKLTQDARLLEIEVMVDVQGEVSDEQLRGLARADVLSESALVKASLNSSNGQISKLRFAVKGMVPGLMARLCDRAGLKILAMRRIRIGRVAMSGLPVGQWRYLPENERF